MRSLTSILILLACLAPRALGQIQVEVAFDQEQFIPDSPIEAKVRILNSSGQVLELGVEPDWLEMQVEPLEGTLVSERGRLNVEGAFELPSSHRAIRKVDLSKAYRLNQPGRYRVVAVVKIHQWSGTTFRSRPKYFDISTGTTLKTLTFGVPDTKDALGFPEFRHYKLIQANQPRMVRPVPSQVAVANPTAEIRLYLSITDATDRETIKLIQLGPMISFSRPEMQLDEYSNLHLLYQYNGKSFSYHMVTPDGLILAKQTHDYTESRPVLSVSKEGNIGVVGGARRMTASDLPPSNTPPEDAVENQVVAVSGELADNNAAKPKE